MVSKKEHKKQIFLWNFIEGSGFEEYAGEELKRELTKQFCQEIVDSRRETKPSKGLWNSIKRSFGWGGYETQEIDVTLAEKIKNMDRDELEEYWEPMAKQQLKDSLSEQAGDLARPITQAFKRRSQGKNYPDLEPGKLWDLAVELNAEIPALRLDPRNLDSLFWIDTYIKEKYPKEYKKLVPNFDSDSPIQTIHDLVELAQKYDETDKKIIGSWLHSEKPRMVEGEYFEEVSSIFPYVLKESNRQWKKEQSSTMGRTEEAKNEKEKTGLKRLERGSNEGENDERNELKGLQKSPHTSERKHSAQLNRGESR